MIRKISLLGLIAALSFSLSNCSNDPNQPENTNTTVTNAQGEENSEEAPPITPTTGVVAAPVATTPIIAPPPPTPLPSAPFFPVGGPVAPIGPIGHGSNDSHESFECEEIKECSNNSDCHNNNPCVFTECCEGKCIYKPIPGCAYCNATSDCPPGPPCTNPICEDNICRYRPISGCLVLVGLQLIPILPTKTTIAVGTRVSYTAIATYADAVSGTTTTVDVTGATAFTSEDQSIIENTSTPNDNTYEAVSPGVTAACGSFGGLSDCDPVTVVPVALVSIQISIDGDLSENKVIQFIATGTYADNSTKDITTKVLWSSSQPEIAAFGTTPDEQGLLRWLTGGSTTISAALGDIKNSADFSY